jgi:glycerophosphoryl diester phosphodiesterase
MRGTLVQAMRSPLIIGHRGFASRLPDNSLAGVEAAIAAGADGVEVDVRPCADGTWVCHHDRSRGGRPVREWDREALRREAVPTVADVVAAVPVGRIVFVEVKPLPAADLAAGLEALVGLLRQSASGVRVISSSERVLSTVRQVLLAAAFSLVFGEIPEPLPHDLELSPSQRLVEALLASGRPLHPWTVNRPDRMRELARLGVASITTDDPALALEVLRG